MTNADDYIWRLAKGCAELGVVPIMHNSVNMCPVDYVADCIVLIGSRADAIGKVFHMSNPDKCAPRAGRSLQALTFGAARCQVPPQRAV